MKFRNFRETVSKNLFRPATFLGLMKETFALFFTAALFPSGFRGQEMVDGDGGVPVVLVHGYGANRSNWWFVERRLRGAGFGSVFAMNYDAFGADVNVLVDECAVFVGNVLKVTGSDTVHLVGHSLGGLVVRKVVQDGLVSAASVVTVSSPHGGTDLALLSEFTGFSSVVVEQITPGSHFLQEMWAEAPVLSGTRFVAYYSNLDLFVAGHRAKILEPELDALNVLVKDEGHLSIMLSSTFTDSLIEQLRLAEL